MGYDWDVSENDLAANQQGINSMSLVTPESIMQFAATNPEEARRVFNQRIANETDADRIADLEIAREYCCNPEFKSFLESATASINGC